MLRTSKETSVFVRLIKKLWRRYHFFKLQLDEIRKNSQMYRITEGLRAKINLYFRYSFFGKIIEIKIKKEEDMILNESRVVVWLINLYKKWRYKIISILKLSKTITSMDLLKRESHLLPIKIGSIITIVAIFTNIIFSILLKKEIGLFGWFIRISLLLIGFSGLSSNATWEDVNKTSYFVNRIKNQ